MSTRATCLVIALMALGLDACTSSDEGPTCSFDDPATLATSTWPKFRHDTQNTGAVANPNVATNPGARRWVFPALNQAAKGAFAASPVLNADESRIYIGSTDGTMYAIKVGDGTQDVAFNLTISQPIISTALAARRDQQDAVFFGGGDSRIYAVNATGVAQASFWPFVFGTLVTASPTLGKLDGTVYTAAQDGLVFGVCPNGISRFGLSVQGTQSSPAMATDGLTVYFGADDHQLRATTHTGIINWTFSASAPIIVAPVVDPSDNSVYVADSGGQVFRVDSNGRPFASSGTKFDFLGQNGAPVGPIQSSPALAGDHLYFGSDDGNLYAIDKDTGKIDWQVVTGGPVISSPAVATAADGSAPIVIVGSDHGSVYFVQDNGATAAPTAVATVNIGAAVRSSPAIGGDGTIYVGADDGRVYAIGKPL